MMKLDSYKPRGCEKDNGWKLLLHIIVLLEH